MTRARDVANLIGSGNYSSTTFTATAGQTAFTISHTQGFVQVFMNGLLLDETVDYTSNGSAVTLTSGAAAGDEIEVVAYNTFSVGDALPKSGGNITGDLTVDTDTLKVDSTNDRVLINTTTEGRHSEGADILTIAAPDDGHSGITVRSGTSSYGSLYFSDATSGAGEYAGSVQFSHSNNQLALGVAGSDFLKIDSSGRVTKPSQPCFLVNGNQGGWQTVSASATSTVAFHQEQFDQGNCFNNSTMKFVAPVAGKYLLHFSAYVRLETQDDDTNHAYTRIQKNGSNYAETFHVYGYQNNGDADQQTTITVIVDMAANDYAMCALSAASGSASFYQPGCQFMGYLIG